ncbi:hypothetical protein ACS0TY_026653 [Phlomoides rotata]
MFVDICNTIALESRIDEANDQMSVRTSVGSNNPELATASLLSECVFNSNKGLSIVTQIEFSGDGSIPNFDVCPIQKRKPLLSDQWSAIMIDGVGQEFIGGAVEFRDELIKYVTAKEYWVWLVYKGKTYGYEYIFYCFTCQSQSHVWCRELVVQPNKRFGSSVLGRIVLQNVKSDPTILTKEIVQLIKDGYGIDFSYWMGRRSIETARE